MSACVTCIEISRTTLSTDSTWMLVEEACTVRSDDGELKADMVALATIRRWCEWLRLRLGRKRLTRVGSKLGLY